MYFVLQYGKIVIHRPQPLPESRLAFGPHVVYRLSSVVCCAAYLVLLQKPAEQTVPVSDLGPGNSIRSPQLLQRAASTSRHRPPATGHQIIHTYPPTHLPLSSPFSFLQLPPHAPYPSPFRYLTTLRTFYYGTTTTFTLASQPGITHGVFYSTYYTQKPVVVLRGESATSRSST